MEDSDNEEIIDEDDEYNFEKDFKNKFSNYLKGKIVEEKWWDFEFIDLLSVKEIFVKDLIRFLSILYWKFKKGKFVGDHTWFDLF